uniref:Uncharacterized protein n=1 Tax=Pristionchus pacificus TaxID=54126 RepID=A0A2A6CH62_PRIPA|eukprot:PDM77361.1 hypothetical protein PRIPAC_33091 [Pristionchus pacificus]
MRGGAEIIFTIRRPKKKGNILDSMSSRGVSIDVDVDVIYVVLCTIHDRPLIVHPRRYLRAHRVALSSKSAESALGWSSSSSVPFIARTARRRALLLE